MFVVYLKGPRAALGVTYQDLVCLLAQALIVIALWRGKMTFA